MVGQRAYNVKGVRLKNCIYFVMQNNEDFDDIYKMLLSMSLKNLSMGILKGQGNSWPVVTITLCQCIAIVELAQSRRWQLFTYREM